MPHYDPMHVLPRLSCSVRRRSICLHPRALGRGGSLTMSKYMHAAAMCDIDIASSGPIRIDERKIIAPQIRAQRDWKQAATEPKEDTPDPETPEKAKSPEEKTRELLEKYSKGTTPEKYNAIGEAQVRRKQREQLAERERIREAHKQEAAELQRYQDEEDGEVRTTTEAKLTKRKAEIEDMLQTKRIEKEEVMRTRDEEAAEIAMRNSRVHPIDILQSQIATDLAMERQAELGMIDEAADPTWMDKLDSYMTIEKDAWREHTAVMRQSGVASPEHRAAVEALQAGDE